MVLKTVAFNALAMMFVWMIDDPRWAPLKNEMDNDTRELGSESDYLRTEVSFLEEAGGPILVLTESYCERGADRVAMKETRRVPLKQVRRIEVIEDRGAGEQERRFLILVQYRTEATRVYLQQEGNHEAFGHRQAFTMGTYIQTRAEQIVESLTRICLDSGATLD